MTRAEQLAPALNQALARISDALVDRAEKLGSKHTIGAVVERSPLKNLQAVAASPDSGLRVLQNFIRYQAGRREASSLWKERKEFAPELVTALDELSSVANAVKERVAESGIAMTDDEVADLHLRLARLFLGYLGRYHVAAQANAGAGRGGR